MTNALPPELYREQARRHAEDQRHTRTGNDCYRLVGGSWLFSLPFFTLTQLRSCQTLDQLFSNFLYPTIFLVIFWIYLKGQLQNFIM